VFQGWVVINNTFASMLMAEGDYCPGNNPRQTKVFIKCGNEHKLISVDEPATCHYEMDFQTPLACPRDSSLVYPVLSAEGRAKWEEIEENLWREEITTQGYNKQRQKLFINEGFVASDGKRHGESLSLNDELSSSSSSSSSKKQREKEKRKFRTLELCSQPIRREHSRYLSGPG
ncbi:hypothetical protein QZH41_018447, partial [Actinostola sp. cb2023]